LGWIGFIMTLTDQIIITINQRYIFLHIRAVYPIKERIVLNDEQYRVVTTIIIVLYIVISDLTGIG